MLRFNRKPAEKYFANIERVRNTFIFSYFLNSGYIESLPITRISEFEIKIIFVLKYNRHCGTYFFGQDSFVYQTYLKKFTKRSLGLILKLLTSISKKMVSLGVDTRSTHSPFFNLPVSGIK